MISMSGLDLSFMRKVKKFDFLGLEARERALEACVQEARADVQEILRARKAERRATKQKEKRMSSDEAIESAINEAISEVGPGSEVMARIERLARRLCQVDGHDPDRLATINVLEERAVPGGVAKYMPRELHYFQPCWTFYQHLAREALK